MIAIALLSASLASQVWAADPAFAEFLARVDRAHPALRALAAERDQADAALLERAGAFDPVLGAKTSERLFHSSSSLGRPSEAKEHEASLDLLSRWGARASLSGRQARGDLKTPVTPTGRDGTLSYSLSVPILRGALSNPRAAAESKARVGVSGARAAYEAGRLRLLTQAGESYWKWVAASRKLDIERRLLENAEFRLAAVSTRTARGDLPRVARVEAEQEVWIRRGRWQRAIRASEQAALSLSGYIWTDDGRPAPVPEAVASPEEVEARALTPDELDAAVNSALAARPEPRGLRFAREAALIDRTLARNSVLPQLDALWSQGEDRGAGGIGPVRRLGLEFSVPLFFRQGRGQARQANLSIERLDWLEKNLTLRIANEVRDAASAVRTDAERLEAARREAALAAELERAERAAFDLGDSTLFLVNQRERAAAEASARFIDARSDYEASLLALAAARGAL